MVKRRILTQYVAAGGLGHWNRPEVAISLLTHTLAALNLTVPLRTHICRSVSFGKLSGDVVYFFILVKNM